MKDVTGPFLGSEALATGVVTRHQLRTDFRAVHRNVYLPKGQELTPVNRAVAAWLWSDRRATLAGLSASALYRTKWIDDQLPAELNRTGRDKAAGIIVHSDVLADDERCVRNGMALTTPARTAFDLGRRKSLQEAVIRIDALARATELKIADVDLLVERHRGVRGIVQLRRALKLVDGGSESPWETRTRLVLVSAGLLSLRTQIPVFDGGHVIARIDMGWEEFLVGVEFDGAQHWTDPGQRTWDIDRLAILEALGWRIVRVSADLLRSRPAVLIARVTDALRSAGARA
jgi:very-short-patch-repair endonuclease